MHAEALNCLEDPVFYNYALSNFKTFLPDRGGGKKKLGRLEVCSEIRKYIQLD